MAPLPPSPPPPSIAHQKGWSSKDLRYFDPRVLGGGHGHEAAEAARLA